MDLRQLEIIRAIADTGSFTAAGEKLHVSQSAISRQILLLEEELGESVFHRIGRRIRITPAGESLLQLSHRVFQDLQDTVTTISEKQESLRGSLRLVGGMTVCLYVFPTLLSEVRGVRSVPPHAAARRGRPGIGAGARRSTPCPDLPELSAGDEAADLPRRLEQAAVHPVRNRLDHQAPRRRAVREGADRGGDRDGN